MRDIHPSQVVSLIQQMFPDSSRQERNPAAPKFILEPAAAPRVSAIVEIAKAIPEHLLTIEGDAHTLFITSLKVLESWASNGGWGQNLFRIQGLSQDNPLTTVLKTLRECPDEYPSPATSTLAFIHDDDLRTSLRLDLYATEQAINNGEWKAATVLGGAVVEALLLWKLSTLQPIEVQNALEALKSESNSGKLKPVEKLDSWDLWQYIKVASHLRLISEQGQAQANLAKDFRNFIHPGKSIRTKEKCTRSTALMVLGTAIRIIDEFTPASKTDKLSRQRP